MNRPNLAPHPIYLDCRHYDGSGIGTYIGNLIQQYSTLAQHSPIEILARREHLAGIKAITNFNIQVYNEPIYSVREQYKWVTKIDATGLLHVPHYNAPLFYPGQLITTVHDVCHMAQRQFFPGVLKRIYSGQFLQQVLNKSNHIITVSNFSKAEITKYFKVDAEKIHVIYNGVDPLFHPLNKEESDPVLAKHNFPEEYLLFIGNVKPHKNILGLITAYKIALEQDSDLPPLVILGQFKNLITGIPNLREIMQEQILAKRILFTGYLPTEDLPAIYSRAMLFLFPSFYEGFGLPPLEAMACGAPVITSNVSSIPEVVGDAAIRVDPYNTEEIADAIINLVGDQAKQQNLRKRGLEHIRLFSWKNSAQAHLEVYRKAQESTGIKKHKLPPSRAISERGKRSILFLDQFGDRIGGGQVILLDIIEKFRETGLWNIFISIPSEGAFTEVLKQRGFTFWCIPTWQPKAKDSLFKSLFSYLASSIKSTYLLSQYVRENNIRAIYCNGGRTFLSGSFLSLLYPLDIFWHLHLILDRQQKRVVTTFGRLPSVKSIIAVSNTLMRQYAKNAISDKIYTIANWVSPTLFSTKKVQRPPRFQRPLRVAVVGLICQAKGQWTILDSLFKLDQVEDWEISFYGRPLETEPAQWATFQTKLSLLTHKGWKITHEGFEQDPLKIYDQIDILVIPSLVPEAFGLTAIEAMSREVLVIANRSGALVEIIKHGSNGFLYNNRQPDELPLLLKTLGENQIDLPAMRVKGVETVTTHYHPQTQLKKIHDLVYARVLPLLSLDNQEARSERNP